MVCLLRGILSGEGMALKGVFLFLFVFVGFFELVCCVNMMESPSQFKQVTPPLGLASIVESIELFIYLL